MVQTTGSDWSTVWKKLTMNNERLHLENDQLKQNIENLTIKTESLVLKILKIQANYPYFTEAMFSRSNLTNVSEYCLN